MEPTKNQKGNGVQVNLDVLSKEKDYRLEVSPMAEITDRTEGG